MLGKGIAKFVNDQKKVMATILDGESVEQFIEAQSTVQDNKQEYLAKAMVEMVVHNAQKQNLQFSHSYLKNVADDGTKATVRVTVCHGIDCSQNKVDETDEYADDIQPHPAVGEDSETYQYVDDSSDNSDKTFQNVGGMEFDINLPCSGTVRNPLHNNEVDKYLMKEWIGKIALFAGHIVRAASCAKGAYIDDTNQSSEGIIRWMSNDADFLSHLGSVGLAMNFFWTKHKNTDALFASQAAGLESSIAECEYRKAAKRLKLNEETSDDAAMLKKEDNVDSAWSKGGSRQAMEKKLKEELRAAFVTVGAYENHTTQCKELARFGLSLDPPIKFMSYPTYNAFMSGTRKSNKYIGHGNMALMTSFVDKVKNEGVMGHEAV